MHAYPPLQQAEPKPKKSEAPKDNGAAKEEKKKEVRDDHCLYPDNV